MKKTKKSDIFLLLCLVTLSALSFTGFTMNVRADEPFYGVRGVGYDVLGSGIVSDYTTAYTYQGDYMWHIGIDTLIAPGEVINQLTLEGPSRMFPILYPPVDPYAKNVDLEWETYGGYRPYIVIRSTDWYDHKFELCDTTSRKVTFNYAVSLGIKSGYGSASYTEGGSSITVQESFSRWEKTADQAKTVIVYLWTTFLRVHGDITFFDDSTIDYDVVALQQIDFKNKHFEEYDSGVPIEELPSDLGESFYDYSIPIGEPDKFISISEKDSIGWSESQAYSTFCDVSLQIGGEPDPGDPWWMGLYLSVDLNWIDAGSQTLEIVHSFTPVGTRPLDYFFYIIENPFSTYLLAEQQPVATIIDPLPEAILWDTVGVSIYGQDNSEVVDARLWVSSDASLNEQADTEIIDIYQLHIDDYWFMGFDTRDFSDGTYYLFAKVYDRFGMDGISPAVVEVEFENNGWGQIITPSEGEIKLLGDDIYFTANAYDHSGVDSVQFRIGTSGSWNNAYYDSLLQRWTWIWYYSTLGTHTVFCREIDTFGHITEIDSVTFHVDYGTILTHQIIPVQYSTYSGTTTSGKYDDNSYFGVRCTGIGWGWWRSITDFYFNPVSICISTKVEIQITPCTSDVTLGVFFTDGTYDILNPVENTYSTQSFTLPSQGKTINRIRVIHTVWWATYQWVYIDFIRVLYRIY